MRLRGQIVMKARPTIRLLGIEHGGAGHKPPNVLIRESAESARLSPSKK
jgi:hypothetical protein